MTVKSNVLALNENSTKGNKPMERSNFKRASPYTPC